MSAKAIDCAAYLVAHANDEGRPIGNLQLQKLLFFAQVEYMISHHGDRLFSDDVYAWKYGPVIPRVYAAYAHNGGSPIKRVSPIGFDEDAFAASAGPDVRETLDGVFDEWSHRPAWALVAASRERGMAWDLVYGRDGNGATIDADAIMGTYGREDLAVKW